MRKIIVLLNVIIFIFIGCSKPADKKENKKNVMQEKIIPVKILKVSKHNIEDVYKTVGVTSSDKTIKIASYNGGLVEKLYFDNGDFVKKGQVLAEIDLKLFKVKLQKFLAEFESVKAEYEKDLKLYKKKATSKIKYIQSKSRYNSMLQDIEQIKILVDRAIIKAPESGFIGSKLTEENQILAPGQGICVLNKMNKIRVKYELSEKDINFYKINKNKVNIRFSAYPELSFNTKINIILPEVNYKNLTFGAESIIDNSDYKIKAGVLSNISIVRQKYNNEIVIPKDAVLDYADGQKVFVYNSAEKNVSIRKITTGIISKDKIQIKSGLKVGEYIVIKGQKDLFDKDKVEVKK